MVPNEAIFRTNSSEATVYTGRNNKIEQRSVALGLRIFEKLCTEWLLAIGFLREGKTQTLMITIGVAVGVAVIVFVSALIQAFSAIDNVLMPLMLQHGKPKPAAREHARELLAAVGLEKYMQRKPNELSGGQQQRVAIARALSTNPALLLADEPTGHLDTKSAEDVFALFRKVQVEHHCAVLIVTHDPRLSAACDKTINLVDGSIVDAPISDSH